MLQHTHVALKQLTSPRCLDFSTPWRQRYEDSREALARCLHTTHPAMQAILTLWEGNDTRLIVDLTDVR